MKKTRFKMILVAAFAAFALLFGAKEASAQTGLADGTYAVPTGNFVNSAEADILLLGQIADLKVVLETLNPGTGAYKTLERAVFYYDFMQVEIFAGKDIPNTIVAGLQYLSSDASGGGASKIELTGLRNDAIDLLTQ